MKPKLLLRLAALLAMLTVGITANAQIWVGQTLGSPAFGGTIVTNVDNSITVVAAGNDIWNASDNGYYYFTWTTGNWDSRVRVIDQVNSSAYGGSTWAKTEMMVRWSDPVTGVRGNDAFIAAMCAPFQGNGNQHQYRAFRNAGAGNGYTPNASLAVTFPNNWLRLTRTNNIITMYASPDNATWTTLATIDTASVASGFGVPFPDLVTVGVAITAHTDANSATETTTSTFDQPIFATAGTTWTAPTAAGISLDVQNENTFVGSEASFSFGATNNGAPVGFPMTYQWFKNGVAQAGVTGTAFTWLAAAGDSGAQVYSVGTVSGYPTLTATSTVRTVTVSSSTVLITNALKNEVFAGASRNDALIGNTSSGDTGNRAEPGKIRWLSSFEDGGGYGDNTTRRVTGYFIPWVNGSYTFYVAADDDTDVFLSTDASPANKALICQEPQWSGYNNWTNAGGGGDMAILQKCSNTWTNDLGVTNNPTGIALTAGNLYYVELVVHNGGGGDNASLTAQLFTEVAPSNGQASTLTSASNNIVVRTWQPTSITFAGGVFPTNTTVSEGQGVTFYGRPVSDSEFHPHYQWQRYSTNIPGATQSSYSINPTIAANNNMPLRLIATVPGLASVTSAVAVLTIQTAVFEPGFVLNQKWNGVQNIDGATAGTLGTPSFVAAIPALEASINTETGEGYTRQLAGFLVPSTTGLYDMYTASDDPSTIFLGTTSDPSSKREIARGTAWGNPWEWTVSAGGENLALKCSATWTNASTGGVAPYAAGLNLAAGTRYYVEVNQSEGGGGDHVETAFVPHNTIPNNGQDYAASGTLIGINAPKANYVAFTVQPTNPIPLPAGPASAGNFYAFGITDSQIAVGDIRANGPGNTEIANQFVFFQWFRNGTAIPGATASRYTLTGLRPTDNGAQFMCQMRSLGYGIAPNTRFWSNSLTATLSVTNDPAVPTITYAGYYVGTEPFGAQNWISITFSIPMDPFTLTNIANYTVPGATVQQVVVSPDGRRVQIAVDVLPTGTPTITVTGARTWSNVALSSGNVQAHALPGSLTLKDIGRDDQTTGQLDPTWPSRLYIDGPAAYTMASQGSDIWNANDGFGFLYEQKTGDFDAVIRQTAYSTGNRWAKVGLMARETIDDRNLGAAGGSSRNWNIVNDPPDVPCLSDGNGANAVEANWRTNTALNSAGWGNGTTRAPSYPNAWVRLKRTGQILRAYAGGNGQTWTLMAEMDCTARSDTPPLPAALFVGICVTGHHNDGPAVNPNALQFYNYGSVDNYTSAYVEPPPAVTLSIVQQGANVQVSWTPATAGSELYSSTDFVSWNLIGTANPSSVAIGSTPTFFRVVTPFP